MLDRSMSSRESQRTAPPGLAHRPEAADRDVVGGAPRSTRAEPPPLLPEVTVAVVGICGAAHLRRCLEALEAQERAPGFEIVVAYDPALEGVEELARDFPEVRLSANAGQRTPLELASRAVDLARGELVLLTEDHCIPRADWVRTMVAAERPDRAVVGGRVEVRPGTSAVGFAFYFVDFFRYSEPASEGPSPTLTVCNVMYKKSQLEELREVWDTYFHETAINDALRQRFGELWLEPESEVTMKREVGFAAAIYERYAFGRLFGCTRLEFCGPLRRLYYLVFGTLLAPLLFGRMAAKALPHRQLRTPFLRAVLPLATMVVWWSWGEWLGYLTARHPRSLLVAPEVE